MEELALEVLRAIVYALVDALAAALVAIVIKAYKSPGAAVPPVAAESAPLPSRPYKQPAAPRRSHEPWLRSARSRGRS